MFMRCPGSVQFAQKVGERRDSKAAAEGTVAHGIREKVLEFGFDLEDFLGQTLQADGFEFEVTKEMLDHLRPGIEWVEERQGRVVIEHQVDLSRWMPGQFGTLDCGIIGKREIIIDDLKFGEGVPVDPVEHEPTMAYALGFWDNVARHETKATEFLIHIDQPRNEQGGGEWRISLDDLLAWGEKLTAAFEAANAEDPPLVPGEKQCLFCPCQAVCPAYAKWAMDLVMLDFEDMDSDEVRLSDIDSFTSEHRALIAKHKGAIDKWLKKVHARVVADALRGQATPGVKLVKGRKGPRFWKDEDAAAALILDHLDMEVAFGEPPLISPTKIEDLKKKNEIPPDVWKQLEPLIGQTDGKPSLVDEGDSRPALSLADEFEDLDDEWDESD